MTNFQIIKRLFKTYTKNYVNKILISVFFSLLVAGSTSSIAWLLDPAIEKIFVEKEIIRKKNGSMPEKGEFLSFQDGRN